MTQFEKELWTLLQTYDYIDQSFSLNGLLFDITVNANLLLQNVIV